MDPNITKEEKDSIVNIMDLIDLIIDDIRDQYGDIAADVVLQYINLTGDYSLIDMEIDKIVDYVLDILAKDDKLRRQVLFKLGTEKLKQLKSNGTYDERILLGYLYEAAYFMVSEAKGRDKFKKAMVALDVALLYNASSGAYACLKQLFLLATNTNMNLNVSEWNKLRKSLLNAESYLGLINLFKWSYDNKMPLTSEGWSDQFQEGNNYNQAHHFSFYFLAGVLYSSGTGQLLSEIQDGGVVPKWMKGILKKFTTGIFDDNPADVLLSYLAISASQDSDFWEDCKW